MPTQGVNDISALINGWENIFAYWEKSRRSEVLAGKCVLFHTVNVAGGSGEGKCL